MPTLARAIQISAAARVPVDRRRSGHPPGEDLARRAEVPPAGCESGLRALAAAGVEQRSPAPDGRGSKQSLAAASWAPDGWGVGMLGHSGWSRQDLTWLSGQDVV